MDESYTSCPAFIQCTLGTSEWHVVTPHLHCPAIVSGEHYYCVLIEPGSFKTFNNLNNKMFKPNLHAQYPYPVYSMVQGADHSRVEVSGLVLVLTHILLVAVRHLPIQEFHPF